MESPSIFHQAEAARAEAAEAHLFVRHTEAAASAAFAEVERRAHSDAARLQVRYQWSEEQRRLLSQQVIHLRNCQSQAEHMERVNAQLRLDIEGANQETSALREDNKRLRLTQASQVAEINALHELNRKITEDVKLWRDKFDALEEANVRLQESVRLAAERQRRIEELEKSNNYLRQQNKNLKYENAGRARSFSPDIRGANRGGPERRVSPTRRGEEQGAGASAASTSIARGKLDAPQHTVKSRSASPSKALSPGPDPIHMAAASAQVGRPPPRLAYYVPSDAHLGRVADRAREAPKPLMITGPQLDARCNNGGASSPARPERLAAMSAWNNLL